MEADGEIPPIDDGDERWADLDRRGWGRRLGFLAVVAAVVAGIVVLVGFGADIVDDGLGDDPGIPHEEARPTIEAFCVEVQRIVDDAGPATGLGDVLVVIDEGLDALEQAIEDLPELDGVPQSQRELALTSVDEIRRIFTELDGLVGSSDPGARREAIELRNDLDVPTMRAFGYLGLTGEGPLARVAADIPACREDPDLIGSLFGG